MKCTITRASAEARPPLIQRQLSPRPRPGPRQFCHDRPEHAPEAGFLIFRVLSSDVLRTQVWSEKAKRQEQTANEQSFGPSESVSQPRGQQESGTRQYSSREAAT